MEMSLIGNILVGLLLESLLGVRWAISHIITTAMLSQLEMEVLLFIHEGEKKF